MIYLLLLTLIILFVLIYFASNRVLINPSSIFVAMFILATTVAAIYSKDWGVDITLITYLVILLGLLMFFAGEITSKKVVFQNKINTICKTKNEINRKFFFRELKISNMWLIVINLIELVVFYYYFRYTYNLSVLAGNVYGIDKMLNFAYYGHYSAEIVYEQHTLLTLGIVFSHCIAVFSAYIFVGKTIYVDFKLKDLKYLLPLFIYLAQSVLATGRTRFIRIIIVMLMLVIMMIKDRNNWSTRNNYKIVKYLVFGMILFIIVYRSYGILRGSLYTNWDEILSYVGKPIIALDFYLNNPTSSEFFGSETLGTVYTILRKLGFDIPYKSISLEPTFWSTTGTNIYTAFRRYIHDFTIIGLIVIQFLMGFLYGYLFKGIRKGKMGLNLIFYSMFMYPIVESIFEERFLLGVVSAGSVYTVIFLTLLYKYFVRTKNYTR